MFPFSTPRGLPHSFVSTIGPAMLSLRGSVLTALSPGSEGLYHACALAGQVQAGQATRQGELVRKAARCSAIKHV